MRNFEKAIKYVRANKTWTEEQETRALLDIDHMRCPLRMTHDGSYIIDEICDLMEEFSEINELPEGWWYEFGDEEDIFFQI